MSTPIGKNTCRCSPELTATSSKSLKWNAATKPLASTADELLERDRNLAYIRAWKTGQTGYPLIDACMRAVIATGWINFRMRALLVSFFTLNLDQDWRDGVYHLAQLSGL